MKYAYLRGLKIPVSRVRLTVWAPRNSDKRDSASFTPSPVSPPGVAARVPAGCQECGSTRRGTRNRCLACHAAANRAAWRKSPDLQEAARERKRAFRAANREHVRAQSTEYKRRAGGYPISQAAIWDMLSKQSGGCAICGTADPGGGQSWSVDHCHTTGYIRGVLCRTCNTGLGCFKDSLELLDATKAYLVSAREREEALNRKIEAFRAHYAKQGSL